MDQAGQWNNGEEPTRFHNPGVGELITVEPVRKHHPNYNWEPSRWPRER